jgi:putative membrane protein
MKLTCAVRAVAILGLLAYPALAQSQTGQAEVPQQDLEFVQKAATGGLKEVTLGELAQQQAKNEQVVQFGEHMVEDHSLANETLKALAEQKGIELPQELPADAQQKYEELQQLSDAEFDAAYMDQMVQDHGTTIELFEQQAESGQDPELRAFAEETLPTLREHLELAKEVQSQITAAKDNGLEQKQATRLEVETPPREGADKSRGRAALMLAWGRGSA